jgi:hypothetical protein
MDNSLNIEYHTKVLVTKAVIKYHKVSKQSVALGIGEKKLRTLKKKYNLK